jgi:hypothetical protein
VSLTVLLAGVTVVLAAAVALGPSVIATDGVGDPVPVRTVTVQPGQSLWDIAAASGPSAAVPRSTAEEEGNRCRRWVPVVTGDRVR